MDKWFSHEEVEREEESPPNFAYIFCGQKTSFNPKNHNWMKNDIRHITRCLPIHAEILSANFTKKLQCSQNRYLTITAPYRWRLLHQGRNDRRSQKVQCEHSFNSSFHLVWKWILWKNEYENDAKFYKPPKLWRIFPIQTQYSRRYHIIRQHRASTSSRSSFDVPIILRANHPFPFSDILDKHPWASQGRLNAVLGEGRRCPCSDGRMARALDSRHRA